MSKNLFITGTGTEIGKTFVAALIVKKLHDRGKKAAYFKAAMSGNVRRADGSLIPGDARYVKEVSGIEQPLGQMCPYVYENAYSPHLASRLEGNPVKLGTVKSRFEMVSREYEFVTMEGSGGILCSLCFDGEKLQLEDVIQAFQAPCLIVADAGLGTINNVTLTEFYMRQKGIPVKGMIFNHFHPGDVMEEDNLKMCEHITGVKVLACVRENDTELDMNAEVLMSLYE